MFKELIELARIVPESAYLVAHVGQELNFHSKFSTYEIIDHLVIISAS